MAVECEIGFLYFKWRRIDAFGRNEGIDEPSIEKEIRDGGIKAHLDVLSVLLVAKSFDEFVGSDAVAQRILSSEMSGTPADGQWRDAIREQLFWPRNKILHFGRTDYANEDARRCYGIAAAVIQVFRQMDRLRYGQLQREFNN